MCPATTLRSATLTALICEPMTRSASSEATISEAVRVTSLISPPVSWNATSISRPRMPPRRLISETPSSVLLIEAGPQIPDGPDSPTKLAIRNFLRSRRSRNKRGAGPELPEPNPDKPFSSHSGGIDGAPDFPNCGSESNSLSFRLPKVRRRSNYHRQDDRQQKISYWKILNIQRFPCIELKQERSIFTQNPHYKVQTLGQIAQ